MLVFSGVWQWEPWLPMWHMGFLKCLPQISQHSIKQANSFSTWRLVVSFGVECLQARSSASPAQVFLGSVTQVCFCLKCTHRPLYCLDILHTADALDVSSTLLFTLPPTCDACVGEYLLQHLPLIMQLLLDLLPTCVLEWNDSGTEWHGRRF